jgi:hypothetical protein
VLTRLEVVIGAVLAVPASLAAAGVWVFAESGFDTLSAALFSLSIGAGMVAVGIIRGMLKAIDGELGRQMPIIYSAIMRRWLINPMRRLGGLPPLDPPSDDDGH